jgi:hypothetical protein
VLHEQPRDGSSAHGRAAFASPAMIFTPQGLMLGAGTILVPAEGTRKLKSLKGREQQVLALLSAAYGTAVAPSVLDNIERAAKSWSQGDDFTAHIHLWRSVERVPLDPTFPYSVFHIPWIAYVAAEYAAGVALPRDILAERTPDGGLLMSATTQRLDPDNPEHVRRARIIAEVMIARVGSNGRAQAYQ